MTCNVVRQILPLWAGGDLPDRVTVPLLTHLQGCEACAEEARALETSRRLALRMAVSDRPPPLGGDFAAKVRAEAVAMGRMDGGVRWVSLWSRPVVTWAAAAALLLAGAGLLNGYLKSQEDRLLVSVAAQREAASPEAVSDELKAEASPEVTKARLAALMSRLNPRRDMTDEELDAKYPVVESISQPQGTAMVFQTKDPHTKIVWVLEPSAPVTSKGVDVQ